MDIKLTETGDIDTSKTDLQLTTGKDAILQTLSQRLQTWLGEWFADTTKGLPFRTKFLIKAPDPVIIDSLLRTEILKTPGVNEIIEFLVEINSETREMRCNFKVDTVSGIVQYNEPLTGL